MLSKDLSLPPLLLVVVMTAAGTGAAMAQMPSADDWVGMWCWVENGCESWMAIWKDGASYDGIVKATRDSLVLTDLQVVRRTEKGVGYMGTVDCEVFGRSPDPEGTFAYHARTEEVRFAACGRDPSVLVRPTPDLVPPAQAAEYDPLAIPGVPYNPGLRRLIQDMTGSEDQASLPQKTGDILPSERQFDDAAHRAAHGLIERVWPGLVESEADLSPQLARYALAVYACAVGGQQFLNVLELWVRPVLSWGQLTAKIKETLEQFDERPEDFSWPIQILIRTHRDRYENFRDSGDLDPHLLEHRTCG